MIALLAAGLASADCDDAYVDAAGRHPATAWYVVGGATAGVASVAFVDASIQEGAASSAASSSDDPAAEQDQQNGDTAGKVGTVAAVGVPVFLVGGAIVGASTRHYDDVLALLRSAELGSGPPLAHAAVVLETTPDKARAAINAVNHSDLLCTGKLADMSETLEIAAGELAKPAAPVADP